MFIKTLTAMSVLTVLSGCATIVNEGIQPMRIETIRADGTSVSGADCTMTNDFGSAIGKSGATISVHRSSKDLDITSKDASNPDAPARAISRANAGLAGNIIFGGGIGAIIDHNMGTVYTYLLGCSWCSARRWYSIAAQRRTDSRCRA